MKEPLRSYKQLIVWQKCHELVIMIYKESGKFPSEEKFGITNQMRRAAVSITSNIAEGFSRESYFEKNQFYAIAHGSLSELENQILICKDTEMISSGIFDVLQNKIDECHKLLNRLLVSTKKIAYDKKP